MPVHTSLTDARTEGWTVSGGSGLQGNGLQAGAWVQLMGVEGVERPLQAVDKMETSVLTDRTDHPF